MHKYVEKSILTEEISRIHSEFVKGQSMYCMMGVDARKDFVFFFFYFIIFISQASYISMGNLHCSLPAYVFYVYAPCPVKLLAGAQ